MQCVYIAPIRGSSPFSCTNFYGRMVELARHYALKMRCQINQAYRFESDCGYHFMLKSFWRIWAKSLGEKASEDNCEADKVALIRTIIVLIYIITNMFIIAGVIRRW